MIITITHKGESETCEISDVRMEVVPGLQESSDVYYLLWGEVMGEYRKVVIGIYYAMDELLAQYWTYKNELRKDVEVHPVEGDRVVVVRKILDKGSAPSCAIRRAPSG